jgi:hypothetical protein
MAEVKIGPKTGIPGAASSWRKETLDLLNTHYTRFEVTPFEFSGLRIPEDMQNRTETDTIARQLSEVNNSERITHKFKFKKNPNETLK